LPESYKNVDLKNGNTAALKWSRVFRPKRLFISLNLEGASVEQTMNEIVKQLGNYVWEERDGVINITPDVGRDRRLKDFLNVKLREFSVSSDESISVIRDRIFTSREIKQFCKSEHITWPQSRQDIYATESPIGHDLKFSNLTVREILNRTIAAKGGGWIIRIDRFKDEEPFLELFV
jgi:hypothetical protein